MNLNLVILIVDSHEDDRRMFKGAFESQGHRVMLASNGKLALDILTSHTVDLVLSDVLMPEVDGLELCRQIKNNPALSHVGVVLYSTFYSAKEDLEYAQKTGADRYLVLLPDLQCRLNMLQEAVHEIDLDAVRKRDLPPLKKKQRDTCVYDAQLVKRLEELVMALRNELDNNQDNGKHAHHVRRCQKIEILSSLASKISHNYGNVLNVVIGYAEILERELAGHPKWKKYVQKILIAGEQGSDFLQSLRKISGKKSPLQEMLNINDVLREAATPMRECLPRRVRLRLILDDDLWQVLLDADELKEALNNLTKNAVTAIANNGQLIIEAKNIVVNGANAHRLNQNSLPLAVGKKTMADPREKSVVHPFRHRRGAAYPVDDMPLILKPGSYVLLSVTDNGVGMAEKTMAMIFDPFYSTKGKSGSGLGLTQVYSFVERSGGVVDVLSEEEQGTCFNFYFPVCIPIANRFSTKLHALLDL
ncbi:MAG TPA: hybrid sensor histidine kinase/response regulator [Gammaproteobacteria bacterium]|nr:hybrid sensor histidine kinase/response regulator [Gammaproteobacteria bacterium]